MIALILAAVLAQDEDLPFPPDPFDHSLPPLSVNDTDPKASKEASFLHIGICVGSDHDEKPILIADRLCLNMEAAQIIAAEAQSNQDEIDKLSTEVQIEQAKTKETQAAFDRYRLLAIFGGMFFDALFFFFGYKYAKAS